MFLYVLGLGFNRIFPRRLDFCNLLRSVYWESESAFVHSIPAHPVLYWNIGANSATAFGVHCHCGTHLWCPGLKHRHLSTPSSFHQIIEAPLCLVCLEACSLSEARALKMSLSQTATNCSLKHSSTLQETSDIFLREFALVSPRNDSVLTPSAVQWGKKLGLM